MAVYFFHLCNGGDTLLDAEGRDIGDASKIPQMALTDARGIISHDALSGAIKLSHSIEVNDEGGALVHHLAFGDAVTIS